MLAGRAIHLVSAPFEQAPHAIGLLTLQQPLNIPLES